MHFNAYLMESDPDQFTADRKAMVTSKTSLLAKSSVCFSPEKKQEGYIMSA